jgi:hypothetical protein
MSDSPVRATSSVSMRLWARPPIAGREHEATVSPFFDFAHSGRQSLGTSSRSSSLLDGARQV